MKRTPKQHFTFLWLLAASSAVVGLAQPTPAAAEGGRQAGSFDSQSASVVQKNSSDRQLHAAGTKADDSGYIESRIRKLNQMMPVPDSESALRREIAELLHQQRRFEQQYGKDSVAARSVRARLHELHKVQ